MLHVLFVLNELFENKKQPLSRKSMNAPQYFFIRLTVEIMSVSAINYTCIVVLCSSYSFLLNCVNLANPSKES